MFQNYRRLGDRSATWLLAILVCATLISLVAPLIMTVLMSLDSRSYLAPLPPPELSLQWYERFLSDPYFIRGLRTSVLVASIVTSISAAIGVLTALALRNMGIRVQEGLLSFFLSPLIVPPVIIGFGLLVFLSKVGLPDGLVRLICGHLVLTIPYAIRASILGISSVNPMHEEAALSLGANRMDVFRTVTLPLARSGILVGAIFAFVVSMDDVAVSMFLSTSETYTLPVALMSAMRANFDLSIAAASTLFTIVVVGFAFALERFIGLSNLFGNSHGR